MQIGSGRKGGEGDAASDLADFASNVRSDYIEVGAGTGDFGGL